jgi:hypothetical protein
LCACAFTGRNNNIMTWRDIFSYSNRVSLLLLQRTAYWISSRHRARRTVQRSRWTAQWSVLGFSTGKINLIRQYCIIYIYYSSFYPRILYNINTQSRSRPSGNMINPLRKKKNHNFFLITRFPDRVLLC